MKTVSSFFLMIVPNFQGTGEKALVFADCAVNVDPDPEHGQLGMPVRLTTYAMGTDDHGTEALGFGSEPV